MLKQYARNSFGTILNGVVAAVAAFVVSVVLTRSAGAEEYGTFAAVIALGTALDTILSLGVSTTLGRFVSEAIGSGHTKAIARMFGAAVVVRLAIWAAFALLVMTRGEALATMLGISGGKSMLILVMLNLAPVSLASLAYSSLSGLLRTDLYSYAFSAVQVGRIAAYLTLSQTTTLNADRLIRLEIASSSALATLLLVSVINQIRRSTVENHKSYAWRAPFARYSASLAGISVLDYIVWQRSEVLILQALRSSSEVGYYTVGVAVPSMVVTFFAGAVTSGLVPLIAREHGSQNHDGIRRSFHLVNRIAALVVVPVAAGGVMLSPDLVSIVFGNEYNDAVLPMRITFVTAALAALLGTASGVLYGVGAPGFSLVLGLVLAPISLGLNFMMIDRFGAVGAALVSIIVRAFALPPTLWKLRAVSGATLVWQEYARLLTAAGVMGAAMLGISSAPLAPLPLVMVQTLAGATVYLGTVFLLGAITRADVSQVQRVLAGLRTA